MIRTKTETVTLLKPHEHNEVKHVAGDKIEVLPHEKQLLIEWEIIAGKAGANEPQE